MGRNINEYTGRRCRAEACSNSVEAIRNNHRSTDYYAWWRTFLKCRGTILADVAWGLSSSLRAW